MVGIDKIIFKIYLFLFFKRVVFQYDEGCLENIYFVLGNYYRKFEVLFLFMLINVE